MKLTQQLHRIKDLLRLRKTTMQRTTIEDTILLEFKNLRPTYVEFRRVTHKAIEALLKDHGCKHQILSRTKDIDSLKEKLSRKKERGTSYIALRDVEDLVGIRVILYTKKDKDSFIKTLQNESSGFTKTKIEERSRDTGYNATHIVTSFGPSRLKLSEYKDFTGMKAEVQVTTILHHAWAEIEHDLIYKDIHDLKNTNPQKFEFMKLKMRELLDKYIKKAAEELEEVINSNGSEER